MTASFPTASTAELKKRLQHIIGERNPFSSPRHLAAVENYIEREFKSYGLSVESDNFTYWGRGFRNIIGHTAPHSYPSPTGRGKEGEGLVILGAHFDSVEGSPGADDNASGVTVLLEAARILSSLALRSPVIFCAFNLEESNMIGSTHFAKKLKAAGARVRAMVSLEMVGFTDSKVGGQQYPVGLRWFYPDRGDFIGVVGNWRSTSLLRQFSRSVRQVRGLPVETLTVLGNGFLVPQVRLSDHSPFWDLGYPALLITDTAFFRNPHYHGPSDTADTLDLDFMAKVCQGVVAAVLNL
ncbi:M28 family peptidase [bacterium]|nr:MAG: M28 family peptidase [bacterium]